MLRNFSILVSFYDDSTCLEMRGKFSRQRAETVTTGFGEMFRKERSSMNTKILNSRKMWCLVLTAVLALTAVSLVPAKQAHAAEKSWSFSLLKGGKAKSGLASKTVNGDATAVIQKAKSNVFLLKGGKVILRVRNSSDAMVSESRTYTSYTRKYLPYWKNEGKTKKSYSLWGQLDSSSGVNSAYAGGTWRP